MAREDRPRVRGIGGRALKAAGARALVLCAFSAAAFGEDPRPDLPALRVCVYYDVGKAPSYRNGQLHAIMLENLLGHFREASAALAPAAEYRAAGLGRCDRAAYIGSYYDAALPKIFLRDVAKYKNPFLWINYNIEQLQSAMGVRAFAAKSGFVYDDVTAFDKAASTGAVPDFYRYFDYKGERFTKLAFRKPDGDVIASPDIGLFKRNVSAVVLSTATDSGSGKTAPYITEKNGFFFVADNPFLFIHEQDRYLIFADVLFDFLGLPPRSPRRYALIRLEDIHPDYDLKTFYRAVDLLKERGVPFAISLIPEYVAAGSSESAGIEIGARPAFVEAIRYAQANGGELLIHGYTHDVAAREGCPSLGSGYDYEFWDRCRQRPLAYDSESFAADRILRAKSLLAGVGLSAEGWVTPHYAASPVDFAVFGRRFERTVQRVTYSFGWAAGETPIYVNQFFPYTIGKDHYGQFVWPENLGFVPMPDSHWGYTTPPDIAQSARLTRVVRDAWASFFWHPQLLNVPGEKERLEKIIDGIRASGYEFVSLEALRARGE